MYKALGALAAALGWAVSVMAHHGITAQFDTSATFEVSGVVTGLEFVNPHAYVYFDVTEPSGAVVPWRCGVACRDCLAAFRLERGDVQLRNRNRRRGFAGPARRTDLLPGGR